MDRQIGACCCGVPGDEVTALMGLVGASKLATSYDPAVVAAVRRAAQRAYDKGIQQVLSLLLIVTRVSNIGNIGNRGIAYATLAYASREFDIVGIIACLCSKDVHRKISNKIEVYPENGELARRKSIIRYVQQGSARHC